MAVDCTSKGMYESLSWCPGQTSQPGIRRKVFFIPKSWIEKWPVLPDIDGAESMAALATYEGDFVLAADKKWQYLEVLTTKSNITSDSQGEKPSKTILNKATLLYAGTDEEASGFCRQANNDEMIYLCQQRNGKFYNPQIQISAESETKRSIFREKDKTKRSKKESAQHSKSRNKSFVMTSVSAL